MSLSLVLPCYNVMKYLPKCLDSIFKNDCNDIEIILVNDGSSDDIGGGLSQYFNKDNCDHNIEFEYKDARIKIITHVIVVFQRQEIQELKMQLVITLYLLIRTIL